MLSVFLADDEPAILRGLSMLVDWNELGLQIVGEASNGDDLLGAIMEYDPDIVVTDISMPGIDGIEVLKRLKELKKRTKVVFISAYRDFSYAKDALSYGAVEYLIKPVDRHKLESVLEQTVSEIQSVSRTIASDSKLRFYEDREQRLELMDGLSKWLEHKQSPLNSAIIHEIRGPGPDMLFTFMAAEIDHSLPLSGSWREGERKLLHYAMQNLAEELIKGEADGWALPEGERVYLLIRHLPSVIITNLAQRILEHYKTVLKISVSMSIGSAVPLEELRRSCVEAEEGMALKFFLGAGSLVAPADKPNPPAHRGEDRGELEKQLLREFYSPQTNRFEELLEDWLEMVRKVAWGNRAYALQLSSSLLVRAIREHVSDGEETKQEEAELAGRLQSQETFQQMSIMIRDDLRRIRACLHQGSNGKESEQIRQIKAYIEENYKEVDLETIAAKFYINPFYFSVFFKKHTGQNFKQYVTAIRMNLAVRLLIQSDSLLYEIAEQVGYQNARQFSEMFKKNYGMLPNEYRQQFK
ncbi:Protein-glutamate methylesterase/protein-glutamine glutaminase [Paenibacillus plantiphilus]|uniref:Protein-glutamate methylesterase/protein-glutamine glutaminase n=1 Tax=Paenibacillus plantiphilus TaxID=2905650 RepID=A0ABN8GHZ3_9BACL|nr:response regulator [Paenibacillus plantiphilus]CAH1209601.1 Protein-glutamate methylesterase/protein-glutamine glutaminase [Paenibacillus plantiphilus]